MTSYSSQSLLKLQTCHSDLQMIFKEVIKIYDNTVIVGHRNEEDQNKAYEEGKSQKKWPNGNHNKLPSMAIDVAPYPIDWNDINRFYFLAGIVFGIAERLLIEGKISHRVRWGGDWDSDKDFKDEKFRDFGHFELVPNNPKEAA